MCFFYIFLINKVYWIIFPYYPHTYKSYPQKSVDNKGYFHNFTVEKSVFGKKRHSSIPVIATARPTLGFKKVIWYNIDIIFQRLCQALKYLKYGYKIKILYLKTIRKTNNNFHCCLESLLKKTLRSFFISLKVLKVYWNQYFYIHLHSCFTSQLFKPKVGDRFVYFWVILLYFFIFLHSIYYKTYVIHYYYMCHT